MISRAVLLATTAFLLVACGGSSTGSTTHATPTTASAAISLLDGSAMKDAKCDQTGLSHTNIASGNIIGTCRISKTGSTYSLVQQYSVTVTAQVETTSRTVTSYAVSLQVGADAYYRTGQNPTGGSYAHSTVAPAHTWSELFFAGANFSNLQQATVNGTAAWTVDATTPGLGEETSPFARASLVADSGSGVSASVDFSKWLCINVDLTLSLHRDPAGEWVLLDSVVITDPGGSGLAVTRLADMNGAIGRGLQTLLVDRR